MDHQWFPGCGGKRQEDREAKIIEAALFTSYMYVKSGHPGEAERLMKSIHEKYPGNQDISCDYVYTLLENQKPAQAVTLINACSAKQEPCMLYLQAMTCMEIHDYKAPDSVYRLWFLIEKEQGQCYENVSPIDKVLRSTFTIVEWGGVMGIDKY